MIIFLCKLIKLIVRKADLLINDNGVCTIYLVLQNTYSLQFSIFLKDFIIHLLIVFHLLPIWATKL